MNRKLREGWEPVRAEDHPEFKQFDRTDGRFKGMVEHGGLILCKTSTEIVEARREFYAEKAAQQVEAVDNDFLRESDRRMPKFRERRTRVRKGK